MVGTEMPDRKRTGCRVNMSKKSDSKTVKNVEVRKEKNKAPNLVPYCGQCFHGIDHKCNLQ